LALFGGISIGRFLLEVFKHQLNHLGVFDAGNDVDLATAVFKGLNIDVENALESPHPHHGSLRCAGLLPRLAGVT
jgi:hypothetical protein